MKSCQSMLAASVLATLLLASGVWAQGPSTDVLVSGERGRSYHKFGSNLVKLLPAFRLENRISSGSVENLALLADGKADLGFAQADVYARSLRIDPDRIVYTEHFMRKEGYAPRQIWTPGGDAPQVVPGRNAPI